LYSSPVVIRVNKTRRTGHVAYIKEEKNAYMIFVGKVEGKRQEQDGMD
jgi:hypothetical protein